MGESVRVVLGRITGAATAAARVFSGVYGRAGSRTLPVGSRSRRGRWLCVGYANVCACACACEVRTCLAFILVLPKLDFGEIDGAAPGVAMAACVLSGLNSWGWFVFGAGSIVPRVWGHGSVGKLMGASIGIERVAGIPRVRVVWSQGEEVNLVGILRLHLVCSSTQRYKQDS